MTGNIFFDIVIYCLAVIGGIVVLCCGVAFLIAWFASDAVHHDDNNHPYQDRPWAREPWEDPADE